MGMSIDDSTWLSPISGCPVIRRFIDECAKVVPEIDARMGIDPTATSQNMFLSSSSP